MNPLKPARSKGDGPEAIIERKICEKLRTLGWVCISTHGNEYQMGLPDIYAAHKRYGQRWIEVKNPEKYSFTQAQRVVFPQLQSVEVGIWILFSAEDYELNKLFGPPNWWSLFK